MSEQEAPSKKGVRVMRGILKSETAKNSAVLFSGSVLNSLFALATVILISRVLSPDEFGKIATFNAIAAALIGFTNFGLDTAAIKIISSHIGENEHKAKSVMKMVFYLEMFSGLLIGLVGLLFSKQVANAFGGQQLLLVVRLAFFSSAFGSASAFATPFLVAHKKFVKNTVINLTGNFARMLAVYMLFFAGVIMYNNTLWAYALAPVLFFFVAIFTVPSGLNERTTSGEDKEALKEIFHFSKWVLLSYIATVISGKLDIFLLSREQGSATVAYYAAAQQLVSIMPMLIGAISTAILPKFSAIKEGNELRGYFRRVCLGSAVVSLALLPVLAFSGPLIHLVFGSKYNSSIPAFNILFVAYLIALVGNTAANVLYAVGKPKLLTYLNYVGLATTIIFYPVLIGRYGLNGAAWAFLLNTLIGSSISLIISYREAYRYKV